MAKYRICPKCSVYNRLDVLECVECESDLSTVAVSDIAGRFVLDSIDGTFSYILDGRTVIIGREYEMEEFLRDKMYVSRKHAELQPEGDRLFIRNYSKMNFTFVNNEKISDDERTELRSGDEIGFGGNVQRGSYQQDAAYMIVRREKCT